MVAIQLKLSKLAKRRLVIDRKNAFFTPTPERAQIFLKFAHGLDFFPALRTLLGQPGKLCSATESAEMKPRPLLTVLLVLLTLCGCARKQTGFVLQFEQATKPDNQKVQELLQQDNLNLVLDGLNAAFKIPYLVPVVFKEGEEQAVYRDGEIIICYDFLADIDKALEAKYPDPQERNQILMGEAHFVLYHEVGHAMVDMFDLPIVGREEDAVDGLATILAVSVLKRPELAVAAAVAFDSQDDPEEDFDQKDYWDVHSLDAQRYYSILCWVHGGAPEMCDDLVAKLVPDDWFESRADDCSAEFEKLRKNWGKLLEPHFKPGVKLLAKVVKKRKKD